MAPLLTSTNLRHTHSHLSTAWAPAAPIERLSISHMVMLTSPTCLLFTKDLRNHPIIDKPCQSQPLVRAIGPTTNDLSKGLMRKIVRGKIIPRMIDSKW